MSGQRRATWRTAAALADYGKRIAKLERRKQIESWVAVAYVVAVAIYLAVTR